MGKFLQNTNSNWLQTANVPTSRLSHAADQITFKSRIAYNIVVMLLVAVGLIFSSNAAAQCTPGNIVVSGAGLLGFTAPANIGGIQYVPDGTFNGRPRWRNSHPGYESITLVWSGTRWEFRDSLSSSEYLVVARHSAGFSSNSGPACGTTGWEDPEGNDYFAVGLTSIGGACGSNFILPPTATYLITGNPEVCSGCSSTLGLTGSDLGTTYRLRLNGNPLGSSVSGTGGAISFGTQTTAGTYSVVASCTANSFATAQIVGGSPCTPVTPSVSIAAAPGNSITAGTSVTFTATPTNGGTTPAYQWKKNSSDVGTNLATYTDAALANGDVISCVMTSNDPCATPTTASSNSITMTFCTSPIRYVKAVATGNGSGENWDNASSDLQAMIDSPCATEVWVAAGTYKPAAYPTGCTNCSTSRDYAFILKSGVKVYGGFAGTETALIERTAGNETIFSGDIDNDNTLNAGNTYHVVLSINDNDQTRLDGCTVTGGNALFTFDGDLINVDGRIVRRYDAGGLVAKYSHTLFTNNKFVNNLGYYGGGALVNLGSALFENCRFENNLSDGEGYGAGLYIRESEVLIDGCHFENNQNEDGVGGGYYLQFGSGIVKNSTFVNNHANEGGGACTDEDESALSIENCTFTGNTATDGAGLYLSYAAYNDGPMVVSNCTFTDNSATEEGGAIYSFEGNYSEEGFTIQQCTFIGNEAEYGGAIYSQEDYSMTINGCTFTDNSATDDAGAVYLYYPSYAEATHIIDCQFTNNEAEDGGAIGYDAIYEYGLEIERCSFLENSAVYGGAISGTDDPSELLIISNTLFAKNTAQGDDEYPGGGAIYIYEVVDARVSNCTFVDNSSVTSAGGGVVNDASGLTMTNCILWNNSGGLGGLNDQQLFNLGNDANIAYSLIEGGLPTDATDGGNNIFVNPIFTSPANGDYTLQGCSPAVNAGNNTNVSPTDLAGNARIQDGQVDMGAYESSTVVTPPCTSPIRYVKAVATGTGSGEDWANASSNLQAMIDIDCATQVWVAAGTYKPAAYPSCCIDCNTPRDYAFVLRSGVKVYGGFAGTETALSERTAGNETILSGDIDNDNTLNAGNTYHVVLSLNDNDQTSLDGCTVTGGNALFTFDGDLITVDGTTIYRYDAGGLVAKNSHTLFTNNKFVNNLGYYGGGAFVDGGSARFENCRFDNNLSDGGYGVGLYTDDAEVLIDNCHFENNQDEDADGGGCYIEDASGIVKNSTFVNNHANDGGGAYIDDDEGALTIENCTFTGNTAEDDGAGLYLYYAADDDGPFVASNCTFTDNLATEDGGAIYSYYSNDSEEGLTIQECTFSGNEAEYGGAIYTSDYGMTIVSCQFGSNTAFEYGGAIYSDEEAIIVTDCIFSENTAPYGGGVYTYYGGDFTRCSFLDNSSDDDGGGVYMEDDGSFNNCLFADNTSGGYGGALYNYGYESTFTNCTVANNMANETGGGFVNDDGGTFTLTNCVLWGNTDGNGNVLTQQLYNVDGDVTSSFSLYQDGLPTDVTDGGNNIFVDPLFTDAANNDYTLGCSPAINAGNNAAVGTTTDLAGNARIQQGTVDMGAYENTAPSATCKPASINLSIDGTGSIIAANVFDNEVYNCGAVPTSVSPSAFNCTNLGANTVTLTVSDIDGDTATCTATVTVFDITPPSLMCKSGVTVSLSNTGTGNLTTANVLSKAMDNCGTVNQVSVVPSAFNCSNLGANIVTLTVNDGNGNTSTCTTSVNVIDGGAPNAICQNVSRVLTSAGTATITAAEVNNGSSDLCSSIANMSLNKTSFNCSNVGANTVILTVTDAANNTGTCTATITITSPVNVGGACTPPTVVPNPVVNGNSVTFNWISGCHQSYRLQYRRTIPANASWSTKIVNAPGNTTSAVMTSPGTYRWGLVGSCPGISQFSVQSAGNNYVIGGASGLQANVPNFVTATVWPNPAKSMLNVGVNSNTPGTCLVRMFDSMGRVLVTKSFFAEGDATVQLPVEEIISGMYYVQIVMAGQDPITKTVIVLH